MFTRLKAAMVLLLLCVAGLSQDGTKSIKSEEYLDRRPESSKTESSSPGSSIRSRTGVRSHVYTVDKNFPVGVPPRDQEYVRLGVTVWRFGPDQCAIPNCP